MFAGQTLLARCHSLVGALPNSLLGACEKKEGLSIHVPFMVISKYFSLDSAHVTASS